VARFEIQAACGLSALALTDRDVLILELAARLLAAGLEAP